MSESKEFRPVNQSIGIKPKFGPLPAELIIPLAVIFLVSYFAKEMFALSWINTALFAAWGMGTWWIITGTRAWRYFSKFISPPYLVRGCIRYSSLLDSNRAENNENKDF